MLRSNRFFFTKFRIKRHNFSTLDESSLLGALNAFATRSLTMKDAKAFTAKLLEVFPGVFLPPEIPMSPEVEAAIDMAPAYLRERIASVFRATTSRHTVGAIDASAGAIAALITAACAAGIKTVVLPSSNDLYGGTKELVSALKHSARNIERKNWLIIDCSPEWICQSTLHPLSSLMDDNKVYREQMEGNLPQLWPLSTKNTRIILLTSYADLSVKFSNALRSRVGFVNFSMT